MQEAKKPLRAKIELKEDGAHITCAAMPDYCDVLWYDEFTGLTITDSGPALVLTNNRLLHMDYTFDETGEIMGLIFAKQDEMEKAAKNGAGTQDKK